VAVLSHARAAADCVTAGFSNQWSAEAEDVALTFRRFVVWAGGNRKRKSYTCVADPGLDEGAVQKLSPLG
jgi:hypothetical protein